VRSSQRFRQQVWEVFQRAARGLAFRTIDVLVQPLLAGMRWRHRRPQSAEQVHALDADALNRAADAYFANYKDVSQLLRKPYSEPAALARRFIDLGVLIDGLRVIPGDTVLELGAGSCWVSHQFNKFGCKTIAVDVSPAALAIGRQVFERDPETNWDLTPEFMAYDGHTLPLADCSVDAIVLYDVFHHLPNPEALLREMYRVLAPCGIVAMSEPGRGHAQSAPSRTESSATGVLESELVLEDVAELARRSGFVATRSIVAANHPLLEIDARHLRRFMGGAGLSRYWSRLCAALDTHYYILLFRSDAQPTTRRPKHLKAIINTVDRGLHDQRAVRVTPGESASVPLSVRNVGDTTWLASSAAGGWTRLGVHLLGDAPSHEVIDYDWVRVELPHDVAPDETIELDITLPPIAMQGNYLIAVDLVVEGMTWFGDRESQPLYLTCHVEPHE
jgi:SAM-dependent methyltransferase